IQPNNQFPLLRSNNGFLLWPWPVDIAIIPAVFVKLLQNRWWHFDSRKATNPVLVGWFLLVFCTIRAFLWLFSGQKPLRNIPKKVCFPLRRSVGGNFPA